MELLVHQTEKTKLFLVFSVGLHEAKAPLSAYSTMFWFLNNGKMKFLHDLSNRKSIDTVLFLFKRRTCPAKNIN